MNNENLRKAGAGVFVLALFFLVSSGFALASDGPSIHLNATLIKTHPVPLQTGEYADIWVKLANRGDAAAKEATFELVPDFPFEKIPDEDLTRNFGDIRPNEVYYAHFQVKVSENAVEGKNKLKFRHSSQNGFTITESIPVQVRTDDTALSLQNISLRTGAIAPSETEELKIELKNLADSYLKNVDISLDLSSTDIPLITIGSTTQKRVEKIPPGGTAQVAFQVKANSDATQKAHKVPIVLNYENEVGRSFSETVYTGLIVGGKPELEVNLAETSGIVTSGTTKEISLSIVNEGLSTAKFVSLRLKKSQDYKVISPPEEKVYIGNMDSDEYESSSFKIYIEKGLDDVDIPIELTYKDSEGNSITEEQTVTLDVFTSSEISRMNLKESSRLIYIIIGILIALGVGYYLYRRRKSEESAIIEEE